MKKTRNFPEGTLDLIFDVVKSEPERQLATVDSLDTKAFALFSVASVLIGLTAFATRISQWLLVATLGAYLIAAGLCVFAVRIRKWHMNRSSALLYEEFWDSPPDAIKHAMVARIAADYPANTKMLKWKSAGIRWALRFVALETLLLGIAIIQANRG